MKASIGRDCIVRGILSNGATEQPAKITRAWSSHDTVHGPVAVNLVVFPDAAPPLTKTSVMLYDTEEEARAFIGGSPGSIAAHWPTRV